MKKIYFAGLAVAIGLVISGCVEQPVVELTGGTTKSSIITTQDVTVGDDLTVTDDASIGGDLSVTGSAKVGEFTQGGGILTLSSSTAASYTLTQAELLAYSVISISTSSAHSAFTLTLPATSTMTTLLPNAGDRRAWTVEAKTASSSLVTTVAAGAGIDLIAPSTADDVIDGEEYATLDCWRRTNTDVVCAVEELTPAD